MDILQKIDEYRGLLDQKEALAQQTKENNETVRKCREELADMMLDAETPKIARSGYSYTLQQKVKYSKAAGADEALADTLRAFGLGSLVKETVSPQTLQSAMMNLAEEYDGELPAEFDGVVNQYEFLDVSRRKDSRRA